MYVHIHFKYMQFIICQLYLNKTSFLLLVLDRHTIDFYISTLYPATLLNSLVLMIFFLFCFVTIIVSGVIQINKITKGDI